MGIGIARDGDRVESPFGANSTIIATTTKTFVNSKLVARVGDKTHSHFHNLPFPGFKIGTITTGSATVSAEGKKVARIGDDLDCGCHIIQGSPDTFSG